jgi:SAM-dependent methyltransferase
MVVPQAPGTILQCMYLKERLSRLRAGRFVEVGPGAGEITRLLLTKGWTGSAYDLESKTTHDLNNRFANEIEKGLLEIINGDFLVIRAKSDADLVISSMVMEHMDDEQQLAFMAKAACNLRPGGRMIGFVPASPRHWGIEDDIAGHCRRYTRSALSALAAASGWSLTHTAGLTFPVSNLLLPISNVLVRRKEREKLALSPLERTKHSGRRRVLFKTHFPPILGIVLNETFLAPFHVIQKLCRKSERALVLYFEAEPCSLRSGRDIACRKQEQVSDLSRKSAKKDSVSR